MRGVTDGLPAFARCAGYGGDEGDAAFADPREGRRVRSAIAQGGARGPALERVLRAAAALAALRDALADPDGWADRVRAVFAASLAVDGEEEATCAAEVAFFRRLLAEHDVAARLAAALAGGAVCGRDGCVLNPGWGIACAARPSVPGLLH